MPIIGEFEVAVRAKKAEDDNDPLQFGLSGTVNGEVVREVFTISDADQTMAWGMFARASMSGLDTADMESLAALIDILEGVVVDEDKPRLLAHAKKVHLDPEVLLKIVQTVMEAQSGRPTEAPSGSSGGRSTIGASSRASSPSVVEGEVMGSQAMRHMPGDPRAEGLQSVDTAAALSLVNVG